jgi:thiosulfate/3-mercaptopyruvate sulfurtransferase
VDAEGLGFYGAAVLDGSFDKWQSEGRPVEGGPAKGYSPAVFCREAEARAVCRKEAVLAATGDPDFAIVNALGPQFHLGLEPSRYGRPGRIPRSVNAPAATLVDPQSTTFTTTLDDAAAKFNARGWRGPAYDRLLWRRHIGHAPSVFAAPARVRRSNALRRLDGRMGEKS